MMDVSYQLYSSRNFTPWNTVLAQLADFGYTQVEGFGGVFEDPAGFRANLDAKGLKMPSAHFSIDDLEGDFDTVKAAATALGVSRIYCPFLMPDQRPDDAAGWVIFATRLQEVGKKVRAAGFDFGWHNHDFEFARCKGGEIPMQILLDTVQDLDWEADIAWIVRGGQDPMVWIDKYGDRITAAHVKDIAPDGENADEDGWADVGAGTLDWPALMAALRSKGVDLFIMEHDNPSDMGRFARTSIDALQSF